MGKFIDFLAEASNSERTYIQVTFKNKAAAQLAQPNLFSNNRPYLVGGFMFYGRVGDDVALYLMPRLDGSKSPVKVLAKVPFAKQGLSITLGDGTQSNVEPIKDYDELVKVLKKHPPVR